MKLIKGDLLETELRFVGHGCNLQGLMGAGVARQIKERYPSAYSEYRFAIDRGYLKLGSILGSPVDIDEIHYSHRVIIHMMTQEETGYHRMVDYEGLFVALEKAVDFVSEYNENKMAIPKIGCGLAGGDWRIVKAMIEVIEELYDFEFWVYEI